LYSALYSVHEEPTESAWGASHWGSSDCKNFYHCT